MKVKALVGLNAFGYIKSAGEVFEIADKGQRLELERLGWIEPLEHEVSEDTSAKEEPKKKVKKHNKN